MLPGVCTWCLCVMRQDYLEGFLLDALLSHVPACIPPQALDRHSLVGALGQHVVKELGHLTWVEGRGERGFTAQFDNWLWTTHQWTTT